MKLVLEPDNDILMVDRSGHLQLVDINFTKKMDGQKTYTICGITDLLWQVFILLVICPKAIMRGQDIDLRRIRT
jgi:hypothetical protein